MCGIAGVLARISVREQDLCGSLDAMIGRVRHRGPDDNGIWCEPEAGIGFAHARLSIIDLTAAGHQPMLSTSGRYVIAYNGEIYNHLTLRAALETDGRAPVWRGHSDTETLVAGFDAWGIEDTVTRAVGMFALSVWDRRDNVLTLVRDRYGEKPLYYGWQGDAFLFGSELPALKAHPAFCAAIDRGALALLMRHSCIPAPYSIYRGIQKLQPGTLVRVSRADQAPRSKRYWDLRTVIREGASHPFTGSPTDAVTGLEEKLRRAVEGQMVSDVPLGAFLSGGVDSSAIVALMQQVSNRPVNTFTIGFREAVYDESGHARAVAHHLGTNHTELHVSPQQALDVIPRLPSLYGEPFADSSQIPTFLVAQLARQHVTVSLSGDAGDELFAGYNRYLVSHRLWNTVSHIPRPIRLASARLIAGVPERRWNRWLGPIQALLPTGLGQANVGGKLIKGAGALGARTTSELYHLLVSHWTNPGEVVIGGTEPTTVLTDVDQRPNADSFVHEMMALDQLTYLPDDILVKVDRAAMGVSLETRVPLLDHRVAEFAWSLPLDYVLRDGLSKWPLRQVLYKYVPKALIERPKMGFGIPIDDWLRGPLRDWAEDLLSESRLRSEGYFHCEPVRQKWSEHLSGVRNWQYHLWDVLMFQAWLAEQG